MAFTPLAAETESAGGIFDTILGLPVHPLAVHLPVVVLPIAALGLVALVLVPRWRARFAPLTLAGLAIGAAGAFLAKESGEQLAARIGEPEAHAELGDVLPLLALALLVVGGAWLLWARSAALRAARAQRPSGAAAPATRRGSAAVTVAGAIVSILAIAVIVLTVLVGHSGAKAAWADQIDPASSPAAVEGGQGATTGGVQDEDSDEDAPATPTPTASTTR